MSCDHFGTRLLFDPGTGLYRCDCGAVIRFEGNAAREIAGMRAEPEQEPAP